MPALAVAPRRDSRIWPGPWCDEGVISAVPRPAALTGQDSIGLRFVAEMYGLQIDQLAVLLGLTSRPTEAIVRRWVRRGMASTAVLSPGPPWVWLTRSGLRAIGAPYQAAPPALARLAHIRAVTAVRLALASVASYRDGEAHWRSERHLRARLGGRVGAGQHLPDAEVHWPDAPAAGPPAWAGECWAIEAELTAKTVARTTAIMRELLDRTGDYGCPAAQARDAGQPPRHARVLYVCSPAATGTVTRARAALGSRAARIEIRALPAAAYLAAPP
jgi:hypothetical protein